MGVITLALGALRFAWVGTAMRWNHHNASRRGEPDAEFGLRTVLVATLAGVRGAVSLAAVLTLPLALADGRAFPARDLAVLLAAGVIVLSMALATLLLPRLLLGMAPPPDGVLPGALEGLRQAAARNAIAAIEAMPPEPGDRPAIA